MKSVPTFLFLLAVVLVPGLAGATVADQPPSGAANGGKSPVLICTSVFQPYDDGSGRSSCDDTCAAQAAACVAVEDWVMPARCSTPGSPRKEGGDPPKVRCRCCRVTR